MRVTIGIALAVLLIASGVNATNSAFKLSFDLNYYPGLSNLHWVSFPFFYFPDGDVTNRSQTAQDVCFDLNGGVGDSPVASIRRFNPTSDTFTDKGCAQPIPGFPIEPGRGYALIPSSTITNPTTVVIVGSHDDLWAPNKVPTTAMSMSLVYLPGLSNLNYLSIPYHWQPDRAQMGGPSNDAKGLCWTVNGNAAGDALVAVVRRFNASSDTFTDKRCESRVPGFPIAPGESYAFTPNMTAPQPINISFSVY